MKRTWKLALLVAVVGMGIVGCGEDTATAPQGARLVEMPTPAGWTRTENYRLPNGAKAEYVLIGKAVDNFSPNILVLNSPTEGLTADSAGRLYEAQVGSMGGILDSSHAVRIGGIDGWLLQYRLTMTYGYVVERDLLLVYKGKDCQVSMTRLVNDSANEALFLATQAAITLN